MTQISALVQTGRSIIIRNYSNIIQIKPPEFHIKCEHLLKVNLGQI